ncbi:hypothetical protein SCE1572_41855 [Sorangium cellulosum So0157-2]|uniref:Uncharacterized protein n=1 Tax=Sorangium cellulosum So0157-2 TaxID=1254432 RepID=S4Y7X8_SORCE|nr:hypothetical protein SCE1572_41855 [Sorangium cellulosum So0157-2]
MTINIASGDLGILKAGKYVLCFAKKVGSTYNVVWSSATDFLESNTFSWTPQYALFGTNTFRGGVTVKADTNVVPIGLGSQSTLDNNGHLGDPSSSADPTSITLINNYGSIHPGVSSVCTDINGNTSTNPIYVAENPIVKGSDALTPVESVMVWFDQNIQTSTMFSDSRSNPVEIDLTQANTATRLYSDEIWTTPPLRDALGLLPFLTITAALTGAVIAHDLALKISAKLTGVYSNFTIEVQVAADKKVTMIYGQRPNLTAAASKLTRQLIQASSTVDQLAQFALQALAQCQVGYTSFDAVAAP